MDQMFIFKSLLWLVVMIQSYFKKRGDKYIVNYVYGVVYGGGKYGDGMKVVVEVEVVEGLRLCVRK